MSKEDSELDRLDKRRLFTSETSTLEANALAARFKIQDSEIIEAIAIAIEKAFRDGVSCEKSMNILESIMRRK